MNKVGRVEKSKSNSVAGNVIFTSFSERRAERKCKRTFCQNVFGFIVFMSTPSYEMRFLSCRNFLSPFRLKSAESQSDGIIKLLSFMNLSV